MLRTEQEARERFDAMVPRLRGCVTEAIDTYRGTDLAALRAHLTKRSDSSNVNDLIWANLRAEFDGEFQFTEKRNRRLMHVGNEFNLRVKKLNDNMRPQNVWTQTVLDFLEQHQPFPGMDPPTNVDLAYRLVGTAEVEPRVYIRCPRSRTAHLWLWELEEPSGVAVASDGAEPDVPEAHPRRARPRRDVEEIPREETSGGSPAR